MARQRQRGLVLGMVSLLIAGLGVAGCETNPYTGRSQLLITSVSQEVQMGEQAYDQIKRDPNMKPSQDPREIEPVKRVAARIIEAAKRSKYGEMAKQFQWDVTVIKDDKTANAFALPGGYVYVTRGIMAYLDSEDELKKIVLAIRQELGAARREQVGVVRIEADLALVAVAGVQVVHAVEAAQEGRLAAARRADQRRHLAIRHRQVDAL